jgi:hypothetical protein
MITKPQNQIQGPSIVPQLQIELLPTLLQTYVLTKSNTVNPVMSEGTPKYVPT